METTGSFGQLVVQTLVATLLSGSIVGLLLKTLLDRRFDKFRFTRDWTEDSLSKVVGPVVMHLDRTAQVAARYQQTHKEETTSYFDAKIMRDSNEAVRSILLSNGHLIPEDLRVHAHALVAHYDVWIRRFDAKEALEKPTPQSKFDVGFAEIPFPMEAVVAFKASYEKLREQLYAVKPA